MGEEVPMPMMKSNRLMTRGEVSLTLGIPARTLSNWLEAGKIPATRRGKGRGNRNYWSRADIEAIRDAMRESTET
jgi:excisionase family DNA binding protein